VTDTAARVSRARWLSAYAAVCLFWGGSYLGIKFAIESFPPLLMASLRYLVAGVLVLAWSWARAGERPTARHWGGAAVVGGLMLFGGNGGVCWAEQRVPSGTASLVVALAPLFMVLIEALRPGGQRPGPREFSGIGLGLAGLALLVGPEQLVGAGRIDPLGALVLVGATLSWAAGSIHSRHASLPSSPLLATALQMIAGGTILMAVGLAAGEGARLQIQTVTLRSWLAMGYLVVCGSIVALTAYVWLLRVSPPAKVASYTYVNPIVAVLLGWGLGGEALTPRTVLACLVIVTAVVILTGARAPRR
jgi:drug/metabolite transporter (DMT)-like permease